MLPTDRLAYSAITERAPLKLPDGARMVVWVIVNVEEWDPTQPMPRTVLTPPAGGSPMPDVPNWAWHEYGNRVGFWRLVTVLDEFAIPGVLAINGSALAAYPAIVRAAAGVFLAAVELAAPVLAATMLVEVAVALLGKLSPQLPVMMLTVPMKTLTGFALLAGSLALWPRFVEARFAGLLDLAERLIAAPGHGAGG